MKAPDIQSWKGARYFLIKVVAKFILKVTLIFAVERRRRDKINNWIVTLSKIIPDCSVDSRTGAVSAVQTK